jgi:hypothetical protein
MQQIIEELCKKHGVSIVLFDALLKEERDNRHLKIRPGITDRLRALIRESMGNGR